MHIFSRLYIIFKFTPYHARIKLTANYLGECGRNWYPWYKGLSYQHDLILKSNKQYNKGYRLYFIQHYSNFIQRLDRFIKFHCILCLFHGSLKLFHSKIISFHDFFCKKLMWKATACYILLDKVLFFCCLYYFCGLWR